MDLISKCALRVAKVVWQPAHGSFAFTVVCKATFELRPDVSPLAAAQEPVVEADVYTGGGSGLTLASELVPLKMRPEVLVAGHAYAPEGRLVPSLVARLAVGDIDKAIQVVGDRHFGPDGHVGDPTRFTRMPLTWERAAGGPGTPNPAGRPLEDHAQADSFGRVPAPNLLPAEVLLTSRSDVVLPVGFGPIAPTWPSRAACLHRHAAWWDPSRWHDRPLPADIDLGYFNAAPHDQQRTLPFGEEALSLECLHPRFAHLSTRLAPVTPAATVDHGAGPKPLHLRCDTLVIDTDRGLAMLVWRAHVPLDQPNRPGRVVVTGPPTPQTALPAWAREVSDVEATLAPGPLALSSAVLPFSRAATPGSSATPPSAMAAAIPPAPASVATEYAARPRAGAEPSSRVEQTIEGTLVPAPLVPAAPLPFASAPGESATRREGPPPGSASASPFAPSPADDEGDGPPTPYLSGSRAFTPSHATGTPWVANWGSPPAEGQPPPAPAPAWSPPPPPLLGAIATVSKGSGETWDTERPPPAGRDELGEAAAAEPEPEVAFDAYPPSRCGAVAARVACDEGSTGDILRAEHLDAARWKRVHERWLDRIRDETARSRKRLLSDYDSAYVSALEAKRGAIMLDDYAHLAEAAERSAVAGALAERGLPEGAWPHIHRVWIQRMVKDVRLGKQVREAIDALRGAG